MKHILMYNPQDSSNVVSFPEGTDVTKWEESGYKKYHEANKDFLSIDWQPMFDFINHVLGTSVEFSIDFSDKRPKIICPNLTEQSGIFAAVVREVEVSFFNFSGNSENFWGTLDIRYSSWGGGSNGMQFGTVWYNCVTKEWKFESTRVRTMEYEAKRGY